MHRRVLALCIAVAFFAPTASALAQRNNQQQQQPKRSKAEQADIDALSSAVDFAAVGKTATDVSLKWDMHHFMKNPDGATVFFHHEDKVSNADAVRHRTDAGGIVFAAASLQFSWGLDDWAHEGHADLKLQRFMNNALGEMISVGREAVAAPA